MHWCAEFWAVLSVAGKENDKMSASVTLAVFASEKGPGDAARASIMSEAGSFLAKKGVRILCPIGVDGINVPLVKSARSAGGEVLFFGDEDFVAPKGLSDIVAERFAAPAQLQERLHTLTDAYLGLPGSLSSVTSLFETWNSNGGQKPVALLNRNRAYELMRGFAVDILAQGKPNWERSLQVSDNMDDLWNRLTKMLARN